MATRNFKRNPKTEAARAELIALSQQAQNEQELLEGEEGEPLTVNQILLMYYKAATGCQDFRRFDQWKEAGYKVKKGESAFRVWGTPVKAKKTANGESFEESAETAEEGSAAKKYKFWPMCCLFNESQVEPMDPDNDDGRRRDSRTAVTSTPSKTEAADTAGALPTGWSELAPGRLATNADPARGGIIDQEIVSGEWFIVFNDPARETLTGYPSRAAAFAAMSQALEEPVGAEDSKPEHVGFVKVAEYRQRIEHLERVYHCDRHSCVGAREWENWRRVAVRVLAELRSTFCKRAKPEDRERRDAIIAKVCAYLDENPTPPPSHRRRETRNHSEHKGAQLESQAPAANDPINQRRDDLGNNESVSRGLFPEADGSFTAMTGCESKPFKTEQGAAKWLARRGLQPNGEPLAELEEAPKAGQGASKGGVTTSPFVTSSYADDLEARREARQERAATAERKANELAATARKMGEVIPFGQPILVGHHSERRDRAYRGRIVAKMDKACEAFDKARYHKEKAATVGSGGIASNDPEALAKLREQLEERQRLQDTMKAANKAIRAGDNQALVALGFESRQVEELKNGDSLGRVGFADYQLRNNNAQIRRLTARIKELETLYHSQPIEHEHDDFTVHVSEGRVVVDFTGGKPSQEARDIVKRQGFRFSRRLGNLWTRKATQNGIAAARDAIQQLEALAHIY